MKSVAVFVCVLCAAVSLLAAGVTVGVVWGRTQESDLDRELKQSQIEAVRAAQQVMQTVLGPKATKVSDDTRVSSTLTNLKTIRSQLQLYNAQHNEQWPKRFDEQMTRFTDVHGKTSDGQTPDFRYGPYLVRVPPNPYTGVSTVTTADDASVTYRPADDMTQGWWYNSATGEFRCHVPDSVAAPDGQVVSRM